MRYTIQHLDTILCSRYTVADVHKYSTTSLISIEQSGLVS